MALKPPNPFGSCFDSAAWNLVGNTGPSYDGSIMCHGIGIANKPGEEGERIAHAWIEFEHPIHGRVAFDPIWLVAQKADIYRKNLKIEFVIEYIKPEFVALWRKKGFPGPYDERIMALTKEGKAAAKS